MIAALPMYDRPENRAAHDRLWALIRDALRARGIAAPEALDRQTAYDLGWGRPDLVLGQICNLPLRARHAATVTWIAAMDYDIAGSAPGFYHSAFIVRQDDPAETAEAAAQTHRLAYNDPLSNSGWGAPWQWAQARGLRLRPALRTGAHVESLRAVVEGRADLAAIDAHTLRNLRLWEPLAARVRVIGRTHDSPGMTLITRPGQDPAPYAEAAEQAIAALSAGDRDILGLRGIARLPRSAYDLPMPADPAAAPG